MPALVILIVLLIILWSLGVRIIKEYERGVVFRFGRLRPNVKQPGFRVIIPWVDQMKKVNLRTITLPIPSQRLISNDNVSMDVAAVAYYHVSDPINSVIAIENVVIATLQIAQTTVRNVIGQSLLDTVLGDTESLNVKIKEILDQTTEQWGILVSAVELKDIQLPDTMQRAMAKQAEAEREKRAKVISAEGEALAAQKLGEAADVINAHPIALQLRNLQVLMEIATEKNSTIVFPNQFASTLMELTNFITRENAAVGK